MHLRPRGIDEADRKMPSEVDWQEAVRQLTVTVAVLDKRVETTENDLAALSHRFSGNQERLCARLEEVVGSVASFRNTTSGCREELECKRGAEQCTGVYPSDDQEAAGGSAVAKMVCEMENLQKEFTLLQKHIMNVFNKLCSDVVAVDSIARNSQGRAERLEAQVRGLHCGLQETSNDVILLKQASPCADQTPQAMPAMVVSSARCVKAAVPEVRVFPGTSVRQPSIEPSALSARTPPALGIDTGTSDRRHCWGTCSPSAPSPLQQRDPLASAVPSMMAASVMQAWSPRRVHSPPAPPPHVVQSLSVLSHAN